MKKSIIILLALTCLFTLKAFPESLSSGTALCDDFFRIGLSFYENREYGVAEKQFEAILKVCPEHKDSLYYLEKCREGNKAAKEKETPRIQVLIKNGDRHFSKGNYRKADKFYNQALKLDPENLQARYGLEESIKAQNVIEEEKLRQRNRKKVIKLWIEALQYYQNGDYENARALFERILSINPEHQKSKKYLAKLGGSLKNVAATHVNELYTQALEAYTNGSYEEAIKYFEATTVASLRYFEALALDMPIHLDTLEFIAISKEKIREKQEEIKFGEREKIAKRIYSVYERAEKFFEKGYYAVALREFEECERLSREYKFDENFDKITKSIDRAKTSLAEKNFDSGFEKKSKENLEEAYEDFNKVLEYNPSHERAKNEKEAVAKQLSNKYYELGMLAYGAGRMDEAKQQFEKALYYDPQKAEVKRALERIK